MNKDAKLPKTKFNKGPDSLAHPQTVEPEDMTPRDPAAFNQAALAGYINARHNSSKLQLVRSLKWLQETVASALRSLDRDERVDAHLIHNAGIVTAEIDAWNIFHQLVPFVAEEDKQ